MDNLATTKNSQPMTTKNYMDIEDRWGAHNYKPIPVVLNRG